MAKFLCRCGKRLSNSSVPNDIELHVYEDKEFDEKVNSKTFVYDIDLPKYSVWKCPDCERLYFFERSQVIKTYKLEEDWQDDGEDEDDDKEEGKVVIIET